MTYRHWIKSSCIFLVCGFWACTTAPEKVAETPLHLKQRTDSLNQIIRQQWEAMKYSDDRKLANINLLLEKIKADGKCDSVSCMVLNRLYERLKTSRYTQQTMAQTLLIDEYDLRTDSLIDGLHAIAIPQNDTLPLQDSSLHKLMQTILVVDDSVIIFHQLYDQKVDSYNAFLDFHAEQLRIAGYPENELQQKPLFRPVK